MCPDVSNSSVPNKFKMNGFLSSHIIVVDKSNIFYGGVINIAFALLSIFLPVFPIMIGIKIIHESSNTHKCIIYKINIEQHLLVLLHLEKFRNVMIVHHLFLDVFSHWVKIFSCLSYVRGGALLRPLTGWRKSFSLGKSILTPPSEST